MRLWEADNGATYWIAAKSCPDALRALLKCWQAEGFADDEIEHLTVDEVPSAKNPMVLDDGGGPSTPARDLAAQCTEPTVLACSEWP